MRDKLRYKRVAKGDRKGMICNPVKVTVYWDDGDVTEEKLEDLEFVEYIRPNLQDEVWWEEEESLE